MSLKVGDTFEVVRVTKSHYPTLYRKGDVGVLHKETYDGNIAASLGIHSNHITEGWHVPKGCYVKTGRLIITKVKF